MLLAIPVNPGRIALQNFCNENCNSMGFLRGAILVAGMFYRQKQKSVTETGPED